MALVPSPQPWRSLAEPRSARWWVAGMTPGRAGRRHRKRHDDRCGACCAPQHRPGPSSRPARRWPWHGGRLIDRAVRGDPY